MLLFNRHFIANRIKGNSLLLVSSAGIFLGCVAFYLFMFSLAPFWVKVILPAVAGLVLTLFKSPRDLQPIRRFVVIPIGSLCTSVLLWLTITYLVDLLFRSMIASALFLIGNCVVFIVARREGKAASDYSIFSVALLQTAMMAVLLGIMALAMATNLYALKWTIYFLSALWGGTVVLPLLSHNRNSSSDSIFSEVFGKWKFWKIYPMLMATILGAGYLATCDPTARATLLKQDVIKPIANIRGCENHPQHKECSKAISRTYDIALLPRQAELLITSMANNINLGIITLDEIFSMRFIAVGRETPNDSTWYSRHLLVDSEENVLYYPNIGFADGISFLDIVRLTDFELIKSIPAGDKLFQVILDKPDNRMFLMNEDGTIDIRNLQTGELEKSCCDRFRNKMAISYDAKGHKIYVTSWWMFKPLLIIDSRDLHEIKRIFVGKSPWNMAIDPDRRLLFVSEFIDSKVYEINMDTDTIVWEKWTDIGTRDVAVDPKTHTLFVMAMGESTLTLFDYLTHKKLARVYIGPNARALHLDQATGRLFVGSSCGIVEIDWKKLLPAGANGGVAAPARTQGASH